MANDAAGCLSGTRKRQHSDRHHPWEPPAFVEELFEQLSSSFDEALHTATQTLLKQGYPGASELAAKIRLFRKHSALQA